MGRLAPIREHLHSLRGQTLMAVVGIHALIIPLIFVGLVFFVKQAFTEQFVNQIRFQTRMLAGMIPDHPEPERLQTLFYEMQLAGPLNYSALLDEHDQQIWELASNGSGASVPPFQEDFFYQQHDDPTYFISSLVLTDDGEVAGELRLGFDERPTAQQIRTLYLRAGALTLGYLLFTLGLATLWLYRLNRPIRELRAESRRVADGQMHDPIDVHTGLAEIRDLAADINDMRAEILKKSDAMEHLAMHDSLTGLPNRALLEDRVHQVLTLAQRSGKPVALLLMDLDHFKEINDTLGHPVGDRVLCMLPERLQSCLRQMDTVARLGGDEFAFLLPDTDVSGAVNVVNRLIDVMQQPFEIQDHNLHLGLSVGIAMYPEHGEDFNTLLRQVDIAMYAAKHNKRSYATYSPRIDPYSRDRLSLASELRRNIEADQLEVYYQPQIRLDDHCVCAVEALCRWYHPEHGLIPSDYFIPLADQLGLMDSMGRVVIRRAISDFSDHPAFCNLALCINLSPSNLQDAQLPDFMEEVLGQYGVSAESVILEITEHEYMSDPRDALRQLATFRDMGFGISIDDFGTGHSSFSYLKKLPATEVKIDKSFVMDMARDRHDYSLVAAIVALGQKLGLSVVAEGVQDRETLQMLADLHCHRAQGYHIARPMPVEDLLKFLPRAGRAIDV